MAKQILCNGCGKVLDYPVVSVYNRIGYGSVHDGDNMNVDLCGECADKVIDWMSSNFKISPICEADDF